MTPTDTLAAGPELDRIVAEQVLSLSVTTVDGLCERFISAGPNTDFGDWAAFEPSTNMAHAWELVEALRLRDKTLMIGPLFPDKWACACCGDGDWDALDWYSEATASTPLAICRAALKAVAS